MCACIIVQHMQPSCTTHCCTLPSLCIASPELFVSTECYGRLLKLHCPPKHRIRVLSDLFGVNDVSGDVSGDGCRMRSGDCVVQNDRDNSVVQRYCQGQRACASFQAERRQCGQNGSTTYQQVEYVCIPGERQHAMDYSLRVQYLRNCRAYANFLIAKQILISDYRQALHYCIIYKL